MSGRACLAERIRVRKASPMTYLACHHGCVLSAKGVHREGTPCDDPKPHSVPGEAPKPAGAVPYEGVWSGHGARVPGADRPDGKGKWRKK